MLGLLLLRFGVLVVVAVVAPLTAALIMRVVVLVVLAERICLQFKRLPSLVEAELVLPLLLVLVVLLALLEQVVVLEMLVTLVALRCLVM
jgi:hypothetical protein